MSKSAAKGALRSVKNYAKGYTDFQIKVRECTSNDPWGPPAVLMDEIADATNNPHEFIEVMTILNKRLNDHGKNWRHVLKSLQLLEYLLYMGSDAVVSEVKDKGFIVRTLREFQYIDDDGRDHGYNVRVKAKEISALIEDEARLREARKNRTWRPTFQGGENYWGAPPPGALNRRPSFSSDGHSSSAARRQRTGSVASENDADLQKAIMESRKTAQMENQRRTGSQTSHSARGAGDSEDDDLRRAIELSKQEEAKRRNFLAEQNRMIDFFESSDSVPGGQQQQQQQQPGMSGDTGPTPGMHPFLVGNQAPPQGMYGNSPFWQGQQPQQQHAIQTPGSTFAVGDALAMSTPASLFQQQQQQQQQQHQRQIDLLGGMGSASAGPGPGGSNPFSTSFSSQPETNSSAAGSGVGPNAQRTGLGGRFELDSNNPAYKLANIVKNSEDIDPFANLASSRSNLAAVANGSSASATSSNPFSSQQPTSQPVGLPSTSTGRPMVNLDNLGAGSLPGTNANPFTQVNTGGWSNQAPKPSLDELARNSQQQQPSNALTPYQGGGALVPAGGQPMQQGMGQPGQQAFLMQQTNQTMVQQQYWQGGVQSSSNPGFGSNNSMGGGSNPFGGTLI